MLSSLPSRIWVYTQDTDMRKGVSGLSGLVREQLQADPNDGSLYLFLNRRRDRMKLLHFVDGGFWLYYRRLEAGTFEALQPRGDPIKIMIDATELSMLLAGIPLQGAARRRKRLRVA